MLARFALLCAVIAVLCVATARHAFPQTPDTATPTQTPTRTPTLSGPDPRRASLLWLMQDPGNLAQPNNGGVPPLMPSSGRLENLTVICPTSGSATYTVKKNAAPDYTGFVSTVLSCTQSSDMGCRDLFAQTGDFVNYNPGDYIELVPSASTIACHATLTVLNQDQTAHDATLAWGINQGNPANNDFCQPTNESLLGASCRGTAVKDGFLLPANATVTNASNVRPINSGGVTNTFTFVDDTASLDIFDVSWVQGPLGGTGSCSSNCSLTQGHRFNVRFTSTDGLLGGAGAHFYEFSGVGQIITGRDSSWVNNPTPSAGNYRYINMHTPWNVSAANSLYCNDRPGLAQNLIMNLSSPAPVDVNAVLCYGENPAALDCLSATLPHCTIAAGAASCTDVSDTVLIPQGYVYTVIASAPGTATGTLGFSFEMAPTSDPGPGIGGCGFATPSSFTPTDTPSPTPTPTPSETGVPTDTPTPTATTTGTPADTFTPTPTPTQTGTPTQTATPTPTPSCVIVGPNDCCDCNGLANSICSGCCPGICRLLHNAACRVVP